MRAIVSFLFVLVTNEEVGPSSVLDPASVVCSSNRKIPGSADLSSTPVVSSIDARIFFFKQQERTRVR